MPILPTVMRKKIISCRTIIAVSLLEQIFSLTRCNLQYQPQIPQQMRQDKSTLAVMQQLCTVRLLGHWHGQVNFDVVLMKRRFVPCFFLNDASRLILPSKVVKLRSGTISSFSLNCCQNTGVSRLHKQQVKAPVFSSEAAGVTCFIALWLFLLFFVFKSSLFLQGLLSSSSLLSLASSESSFYFFDLQQNNNLRRRLGLVFNFSAPSLPVAVS